MYMRRARAMMTHRSLCAAVDCDTFDNFEKTDSEVSSCGGCDFYKCVGQISNGSQAPRQVVVLRSRTSFVRGVTS